VFFATGYIHSGEIKIYIYIYIYMDEQIYILCN